MKKLVVYFSRVGENSVNGRVETIAKGFTEILAEKIAKEVDGELYQLTPVVPYPTNYDECVARSRREDQSGERVEYIKKLENLDEYEIIYLGYPCWWRYYPRVVATFIKDNVFVGKTIYPFCTNEEGKMGLSELELKGSARGAIVKSGFACKGSEVNDIDEQLKDWLKR